MRNAMRPLRTRLRPLSMALALTIVLLPALAATPSAQAQTYSVLYNFTGGSDGGYPLYGSLVQDKSGNLYGTTEAGGSSYAGTVFQVSKSGTETVLYNFTGSTDGAYPFGGLVLSGNTLYGTALEGGSGYGVVFAVNIKKKTETVLYAFTGSSDGGYPYDGLVMDKKGNLYGTTYYGGSSSDGTVFEVVPKTKKETVLYSFNYTDGGYPFSGLTLNTAGTILYGTATDGGSSGYGVVFSLTLKGDTYKMLYNFTGTSGDGAYPWGTLGLDSKGNLYGTTYYGGSNYYYGTVFEVVPKTGKETVLYSFSGGTDGGYPYSGAVLDKKGNLYGTTDSGGSSGYGTVFKLAKTTETVLHSFDYSDGGYPICGVLMDSKGDLFGTAEEGGSGYDGVVWEITP